MFFVGAIATNVTAHCALLPISTCRVSLIAPSLRELLDRLVLAFVMPVTACCQWHCRWHNYCTLIFLAGRRWMPLSGAVCACQELCARWNVVPQICQRHSRHLSLLKCRPLVNFALRVSCFVILCLGNFIRRALHSLSLIHI